MAIKKALVALLVLFPASALADECLDRFIQCVQQTGDPMACYSVNASCSGDVELEPDTNGIDASVLISEAASQVYASLIVTNTLAESRHVGPLARSFQCADGNTERAIFPLDVTLEPSQKVESARIIVCFGQSAATPAPFEIPNGGISENLRLICANDPAKSVDLERLPGMAMRYQAPGGISGTFNFATGTFVEFERLVCGTTPAEETTFIRLLREFLELRKAPADRATKPAGTGGSGVRG